MIVAIKRCSMGKVHNRKKGYKMKIKGKRTDVVGAGDGFAVVGNAVGFAVGSCVGIFVGLNVGELLGLYEGS